MAYVFGDQGFAQAVSADQHQIACLLQEVQGEGAFNDIAIDLGRPVPLEVGQGFEAFDGRHAQPPFQATAGTFLELGKLGLASCFATGSGPTARVLTRSFPRFRRKGTR